jgi:hypothetical protein
MIGSTYKAKKKNLFISKIPKGDIMVSGKKIQWELFPTLKELTRLVFFQFTSTIGYPFIRF